jgi:hypothetical protein
MIHVTKGPTMSQQLVQDIQRLEVELKLKKILQKQLSKAEAKQFVETKFGKGLMKTISVMMKPMHNAYMNSQMAINSPEEYKVRKLLNKGKTILERMNDAKKEDSDSKMLSVLGAEMVIELESLDLFDKNLDIAQLIAGLDIQVQRLRPDRDENKAEQLKELLSKIVPQDTHEEVKC